jgi:hypothetical protein
MNAGNFYFLIDDYFTDFPDKQLMQNKEFVNGVVHNRPCFYSFLDSQTQIYWMVPFSSKVDKYKKIFNDKISKTGKCDTIIFGEVMGHEKAFLIQNMCPIIPRYIKNEYFDSGSSIPVRVDGIFESELLAKAKKILALHRKGYKLIFPDVITIEQALINELSLQSQTP